MYRAVQISIGRCLVAIDGAAISIKGVTHDAYENLEVMELLLRGARARQRADGKIAVEFLHMKKESPRIAFEGSLSDGEANPNDACWVST